MTYERTNDYDESPQLHISEAGYSDRSVAVRGATTIGRDNGNDIVLESITVSRQHALLMHDAAGVQLLDLESTNGTLVNGVLLPPDAPMRLADGDVVRIGQVIARYSAAPQAREKRSALWKPAIALPSEVAEASAQRSTA